MRLLQETVALLATKRAMLHEALHSVVTLALGSAHVDYGFDPACCPGAFNLGSRGQDLKYSFLLYETLARSCTALKNVVVFHPLSAAGFLAESDPATLQLCPIVNELFGLGVDYRDTALGTAAAQARERLRQTSIVSGGYSGFLPLYAKPFRPQTVTPGELRAMLLKPTRGSDAEVYLARMIVLARHLGHRLLIVIPPVRSDLARAIGEDCDLLLGDTREMATEYKSELDVRLLDCHGDPQFADAFFGDVSLLRPEGGGTRLLSTLIRDCLR